MNKPLLTASQQWTKIVGFYEELSPRHRQVPMKMLVKAVAAASVSSAVWPTHSHFVLRVFTESLAGSDARARASVSAEYWHEIDKFRLRYFHIRGIPYDEKWCELAEAEATLRQSFRLLREDYNAASTDSTA